MGAGGLYLGGILGHWTSEHCRFPKSWGIPPIAGLDGVFRGKSEKNMDENWGYLHFRKPPFSIVYLCHPLSVFLQPMWHVDLWRDTEDTTWKCAHTHTHCNVQVLPKRRFRWKDCWEENPTGSLVEDCWHFFVVRVVHSGWAKFLALKFWLWLKDRTFSGVKPSKKDQRCCQLQRSRLQWRPRPTVGRWVGAICTVRLERAGRRKASRWHCLAPLKKTISKLFVWKTCLQAAKHSQVVVDLEAQIGTAP